MLARAQPVEVVEHLEGRRIPVGAVRRLRRTGAARRRRAARSRAARRAASGAAAARGARQTEIDERVPVLLSCGGPGRRDMGVNLAERRLRESGACPGACADSDEITMDVRFTRASLLCRASSSRLPASGCSRRRGPCAENGAFSDPLRFSAAAATPRDRPSGSCWCRESPRLP